MVSIVKVIFLILLFTKNILFELILLINLFFYLVFNMIWNCMVFRVEMEELVC